MSRMINLEEWAKLEFGENAPSERILKKYAKAKMISPPAIKVGRKWMVDHEARYIGIVAKPQLAKNYNEKLQRIILDGSQTSFS
ncbi:excisionase [Candidatus Arsenophonus nilaparvatae]|uniref:excisionase n=1 Tax=Candidatus Arsenophonus nilaparvatae TaxID=1247023 RepID=UPI000509955E|nr:excisionase [Candidatus Arsenophonus nilaparvatae]